MCKTKRREEPKGITIDASVILEALDGEDLFNILEDDKRQADDFITGYIEHYGETELLNILLEESKASNWFMDYIIKEDKFDVLAKHLIQNLDLEKLFTSLVKADRLNDFLHEIDADSMLEHLSQTNRKSYFDIMRVLTKDKDYIITLPLVKRLRLIERLAATEHD